MRYIQDVSLVFTFLVIVGNLLFSYYGLFQKCLTIYRKHKIRGLHAQIIGGILLLGALPSFVPFLSGITGLKVMLYGLFGFLAVLISIAIDLTVRKEIEPSAYPMVSASGVKIVGGFVVDGSNAPAIGWGEAPADAGIENDMTNPPEYLPDANRMPLPPAPAPLRPPMHAATVRAEPPAAELPIAEPPASSRRIQPPAENPPARSTRKLPDTWSPGIATPERPYPVQPASRPQPVVRPQPVSQEDETLQARKPVVAPASVPAQSPGAPQNEGTVVVPREQLELSVALARLEVIQGSLSRPVYPINKTNYLIGRGKTSDLTLLDPKVSREHARLRCADGAWFIQDPGSTSGIRVNGKPIKAVRLNSGDRIQICDYIFIFQINQ